MKVEILAPLYAENSCGCYDCSCGGTGTTTAATPAGQVITIESFGYAGGDPVLDAGDVAIVEWDGRVWSVDWDATEALADEPVAGERG